MAGVTRVCPECGKTLWDKETGNHKCKEWPNKNSGPPLNVLHDSLEYIGLHADAERPKYINEFSNFSLSELKQEVKRREKHQKELELLEKQKYISIIPQILLLVDNHTGMGCTDTNLAKRYNAECVRCFLVDARRSGTWDLAYKIGICINARSSGARVHQTPPAEALRPQSGATGNLGGTC